MTTHSQFSCQRCSSATNLHFNQLLHAIKYSKPSADSVTLIYLWPIHATSELPLAIQEQSLSLVQQYICNATPPPAQGIVQLNLSSAPKCDNTDVPTSAPDYDYDNLYIPIGTYSSSFIFNAAAATLTFTYQLPMTNPPRDWAQPLCPCCWNTPSPSNY